MFERTISRVIAKINKGFPVILITGMRQIGKSWIVDHLSKGLRKYVTLDDIRLRSLAKNDPERFIQENQPPIIIDETQYALELFLYIKMYCDKFKKNGLFWLTGSQKYRLMQGFKESLAGRVAILEMLGFHIKKS
ncbi:MAG: AAA family ATPase [Endomicrobium sp.]|nr:AAA family ATPase [Endomicrobium sp.]